MKKLNIITALTLVLILIMACKKNKELTIIQGVILIGNQMWTTKNLDVATYRNGDAIPQVQDSTWGTLTTGAWCYYENNTGNGTNYGKLYNWYAVNDPRGLAPNGYHIPTDAEWITLTTYVGGDSIAGGKMKGGTWTSQNIGATNSSGFTALPGGARYDFGEFYGLDELGRWWSSSEDDADKAWRRSLDNYDGRLGRSSFDKQYGFSVRCLRD